MVSHKQLAIFCFQDIWIGSYEGGVGTGGGGGGGGEREQENSVVFTLLLCCFSFSVFSSFCILYSCFARKEQPAHFGFIADSSVSQSSSSSSASSDESFIWPTSSLLPLVWYSCMRLCFFHLFFLLLPSFL